jgi:hypothetical protein
MSVQAPPPPKGGKHFTPFYSVTEEAMTNAEGTASDNEGGHMSSTSGRIVRTPDADLPYKVVLTHHGRAETTQSFATMREAEAFIRRNTPVPAARSTLRDQDASEAPAIHAPNDGIAQ